MNIAGSLVRRGFEAHANNGDQVRADLPTWGILMLGSTTIVYLVVMFSIEYTFGRVIPTLIMIESPQDSISFEPLPTEDIDSTINKDPEPPRRSTLITSSFRRTLRHLGSFRARFRGLRIFCVNAVLVNIIVGIPASLPIIRYIPRAFLGVAAAVACAQLSLTWTHTVISQPSHQTWYRRIAPAKMWKKVAGPTAVFVFAEQVAVYIPLYLAIFAGLQRSTPDKLADMSPKQKLIMSLIVLGIFLSRVLLALFLVIPANVALTRVQASLLDDSEETIVPFDRSFGGKVIPEIVGGSGAIGMLEAWKTFDWAARIRLIKAYVKAMAIEMCVSVLFTLILVVQLFIIVGKDWSKLYPKDGKN